MGQYYEAVTKVGNGRLVHYNLQTTAFDGNNFDNYNGVKLMEHSYWRNDFCVALAEKLVDKPTRVCWCGDYAEREECKALGFDYDIIWNKAEGKAIKPSKFSMDSVAYLINKTKGEYVDLKAYYNKSMWKEEWQGKTYERCIFPISLLTALGNDRGGGDYHKENATCFKYVGSWAWDEIYLSNTLPDGLKKINVYYKETR